MNRILNEARSTSPWLLGSKLLPSFIKKPIKEYQRERTLNEIIPYQNELKQIIELHAGIENILIFPPNLDWHTQLFQRPQQLALALARQGALVFYTQPKVSSRMKVFQPLHERMYLCNVPVETFEILPNPTIYILTWNRDYATAFIAPKVIYDYVDEIDVFEGNYSAMLRDHEMLIQNAELVITTAERLYQQVLPFRSDVILCPNGVNYSHFTYLHRPANIPPPPDITPILAEGKPVIGYYGALARWFDYDLLKNIANSRADLSFVLIGPDYDGSLPPDLLDLPNIAWLGVKPYAELPGYLRWFDVATIPFVVNNITHATSPLKLFEYMAAGKPVVITPMEESMRYQGVLVGEGAKDFSHKIDQALKLKDDADYLRLIDQVAQKNTWETRGRQILDALYK